jgi:alpha-beta hydrolase superfamily lysophospholipase
MRNLTGLLIFLAALTAHADSETFTFDTTDGVTVYGEVYEATGMPKTAPVILLFHQGAHNSRAEYEPIIPRLLNAGYHAVAIDQRRGGERFGGINRTLKGVGDTEYSYCDVYPDLEGSMRYAKDYGFSGPLVAWGSSYSAALVFKLGADYPQEIDMVLAFSSASGEAMEGCKPESYSQSITQPVLALRPIGEMEVPYVPGQMQLYQEHGHQTYIADPAVHASSMLNEVRVGASTEATWSVALGFLNEKLAALE